MCALWGTCPSHLSVWSRAGLHEQLFLMSYHSVCRCSSRCCINRDKMRQNTQLHTMTKSFIFCLFMQTSNNYWPTCVFTWQKVCSVANSPPPPPHTLKAACLNFGMWGRVLDVINHAKFQFDWFRSFGPPHGRKLLSPIDWRYCPYNSVRTNVLHCDTANVQTVTVPLWVPRQRLTQRL